MIAAAATATAASVPDLFGILGLQLGSLPMWLTFLGLVAWWIRGMAERRRAANEGVTAESMANDKLFANLTAEVERMGKKLSAAEARITHVEAELRDVRDAKALTDAENVMLRAKLQSVGEIRQTAALIVAADRVGEVPNLITPKRGAGK